MRIGMFVDMYKPWISGVTNHVALNKEAMERAGHEVFVFAFGDMSYDDGEKNVVRSFGIPYGKTGYRFGMGFSPRARALIRTLDVVHVHHPFVSGPLVLSPAKRLGIPVVSTNHTRYDLYSDDYAAWMPERMRYGYIESYLRWFYGQVDTVIAPSPGMAAVLEGWGVTEDVRVLPNGVDLEPFRKAAPVPRDALGIAEDAVAFVYLGRLGPEKNLMALVDAFTMVAAEDARTALVLIGDGPLREEVQDLVLDRGLAHRLVLTGLVDYDWVPEYVKACDAFVTASVSEVHPLTLIEAMAAGLPAIGVRSPGVSDTIVDGTSGILCAEASPDRLATAMLALSTDEGLRSAMGGAAAQAAEGYGISVTSALLLEEYERLRAAPRERRRPGRRVPRSRRR